MSGSLIDRRDLPIFIHSAVDDLGLTARAFRVYAHLARRADKSGAAWPTYAEMGRVCFAAEFETAGRPINEATTRRWAIDAISELETRGLVRKFKRLTDAGDQTSNGYELTPQSEWRERSDPGSPRISERGVMEVTRDHPKVLQ
jgi:hypothetical protein